MGTRISMHLPATSLSVTFNSSRQCSPIFPRIGMRCLSRSAVSYNRRPTRSGPRFRDAYTIKQEEARKAANEARGAETRARRAAIVGDPIRGSKETTSFVKSLDSAIGSPIPSGPLSPSDENKYRQTSTMVNTTAQAALGTDGNELPTIQSFSELKEIPRPSTSKTVQLNHFFTNLDLEDSIARSKQLSAPFITADRSRADPAIEEEEKLQHELLHAMRREAVTRILSPGNASSSQRTKINTQRCIEKFGRHSTDTVFSSQDSDGHSSLATRRSRAGPDTGSSEVQIAILTAKIRVLLGEFEGRSKNDKANKRNLRLLLHRRQKLLKYLERQDRGGPRWHHLLETLGLTEATWKGEINVR